MPANNANNTLSRQWELLKVIPERAPGRTTAELCSSLESSGYKVSKRTVERDLQDLSLIFPLQRDEAEAVGRWHWMRGRNLDLPAISVTDALSLRLVEGYLRPLLPTEIMESLQPRFAAATNKLNALANENRVASWADKVRSVSSSLPFIPPSFEAGTLEAVQLGLLEDKQLEGEYHAASSGKVSQLRLHPLGLVQRGAVAYLVATAFDYTEPRLYAVHRLKAVRVLEEKAIRAPSFSLDSYIKDGAMQFGSGGIINLELQVRPHLARALEETRLSADQTIEVGEQWVTIRASVRDTWQLRWWIFSQADNVLVRRPMNLSQEIQERLASSITQYRTQ